MADQSGSSRVASDPVDAELERRRIRDALLNAQPVSIRQNGSVRVGTDRAALPEIITAPGKFASFHWYDRRPDLLQSEIDAMTRFFPAFKLLKSPNGQLYWSGDFHPALPGEYKIWSLLAIYDNNHPHNSTYGGSIKVFSIDPHLEKVQEKMGHSIPHLFKAGDRLYICTSRPEDFHASVRRTSSAATALAWAAKWISAFQLWCLGEISTQQFSSHEI